MNKKAKGLVIALVVVIVAVLIGVTIAQPFVKVIEAQDVTQPIGEKLRLVDGKNVYRFYDAGYVCYVGYGSDSSVSCYPMP